MVKKCRILLNNDAVTVVDFDGLEVQLPSIHRELRYINVLGNNGKYCVVDDDYTESVTKVTKKANKKINKETTIKSLDNNIKIESATDEK